jgi:hypothetical protein
MRTAVAGPGRSGRGRSKRSGVAVAAALDAVCEGKKQTIPWHGELAPAPLFLVADLTASWRQSTTEC